MVTPRKPFTGMLMKGMMPDDTSGLLELPEKMMLLLDHYGINRDESERWFMLALHLAGDFVPGFQFVETERRGRPKLKLAERVILLVDASELVQERGHSISSAARILATSPRFKGRWYQGKSLGTIRNAIRASARDSDVQWFLNWVAQKKMD